MRVSTPEAPAARLNGRADLTFAPRGGRTRLVRSETRPPLTVQRALYLDEALPDMAFVVLANPTAGVFAGDGHRVRVTVRAGAQAHVTTQAATKVHAMPAGYADLSTTLTVEDGGYLEYLPDPLIPFAGARLRQSTTITVGRSAVLIVGEVLTPGRVAAGESLAYERLEMALNVQAEDGLPLFREAYCLGPATARMGIGVFGPSTTPVLGTLLVVCPSANVAVLRDQVRAAVAPASCGAAGVTSLPYDRGVAVRVLADDAASVQAALRAAWKTARRCLLHVGLPPARK